MLNKRVEYGAVLGVMLACGALYGRTLAPSISWRNGAIDSAELAAAAVVGGIPHPPGYPTYMLVAQGWLALAPIDDPARALNWLSLFCTTLTVGCYLLIVAQIGRNAPPHMYTRIIGAAAFASAPLVWAHATFTEVYALGLLLFSLTLFASITDRQWVAGLLSGLNAGVFPLAALLGLLLVKPRLRQLLMFASGLFIGLLPFLYLPVRAAQLPFLNWGNPATWEQFLWLVRGQQYSHLFEVAQLADWFEALAQLDVNMHWVGWVIALIGVRHIRFSTFVVATVLLSLLWVASYDVRDNSTYLLPAIFVMALAVPFGINQLLTQRTRPTVLAVLMVLLIVRIVGLYPHMNLQHDRQAIEFAHMTLASVSSDAVIITKEDKTTFALWYSQTQGVRRDVLTVDERLLQFEWHQHHLAAQAGVSADLLRPGHLLQLNRPIYVIDGETHQLNKYD
ncbi:MAG: protein O-mannosyl-transferase family [Candidatus Promineifilaceae bacterium]